jgi:hypothetical protein
MTHITQAILGEAVLAVQRMTVPERLRLADDIFAQQPNLLASVLVLKRVGASDAQIEVAIHVLFVAWSAMKSSGLQWPVISEDTQDVCLKRVTARVRIVDKLSPKSWRQAARQLTDAHDEQNLLAFAYGHLRDNGLLGISTEADKYVVLSTLNLVECIAFSAPRAER